MRVKGLKFFYFSLQITFHGLICALYQSHKKYVKEENNTHKTTELSVVNYKIVCCT